MRSITCKLWPAAKKNMIICALCHGGGLEVMYSIPRTCCLYQPQYQPKLNVDISIAARNCAAACSLMVICIRLIYFQSKMELPEIDLLIYLTDFCIILVIPEDLYEKLFWSYEKISRKNYYLEF